MESKIYVIVREGNYMSLSLQICAVSLACGSGHVVLNISVISLWMDHIPKMIDDRCLPLWMDHLYISFTSCSPYWCQLQYSRICRHQPSKVQLGRVSSLLASCTMRLVKYRIKRKLVLTFGSSISSGFLAVYKEGFQHFERWESASTRWNAVACLTTIFWLLVIFI